MAIRFTENVYPFGVAEEVQYSLLDVERIVMEHTDAALYITSMADGRHSRRSYHYLGGAWDFDLVPSPEQDVWESIRDDLQEELGSDWDIIYEDPGGSNEHMHGEYERRGDLQQRMEKARQRMVNRIRGQPS